MALLPKKILVFGATGVIGKYIISGLIDAKASFEKVGIFTSPATVENKKAEIAALKDKGVEVLVGNVESEADVTKAYDGERILSLTTTLSIHDIPSTVLAYRQDK